MAARRDENDLIFLLGSGATVDAGMPTVAELTQELKKRLPALLDVNGVKRREFGQIFDLIEANDPLAANNYERFFEWISLLCKVHKEPFRKLIHTDALSHRDSMGDLRAVIGPEIARILCSYRPEPSYLSRLGDFLPDNGRLKIFTLNYDCCVEDACRNAGIDITTGFDPITKKWNPSLFEANVRGINLYKLHSSLRWFPVKDRVVSPYKLTLMELSPREHPQLPGNINVPNGPELILGPGNKLQYDDPFLTLFYEFRKSFLKAKYCVVIGFGYGDPHIGGTIDDAIDGAVSILDVNLQGPNGRYLDTARYRHLRSSTKMALINNLISLEMSKFGDHAKT
jgi:hypothetical protein